METQFMNWTWIVYKREGSWRSVPESRRKEDRKAVLTVSVFELQMKHSNLARRALNERKLVFLLIKKFPHPFKVGDKKELVRKMDIMDQNPPPQQQRMSRIGRIQPHPPSLSLLKKPPSPPKLLPQNNNKRIIHRQALLPPLSRPHPQFVAVKSLILVPPYIDYTSCYA